MMVISRLAAATPFAQQACLPSSRCNALRPEARLPSGRCNALHLASSSPVRSLQRPPPSKIVSVRPLLPINKIKAPPALAPANASSVRMVTPKRRRTITPLRGKADGGGEQRSHGSLHLVKTPDAQMQLSRGSSVSLCLLSDQDPSVMEDGGPTFRPHRKDQGFGFYRGGEEEEEDGQGESFVRCSRGQETTESI